MFGQLHPVPSNIKMSELIEYERGEFITYFIRFMQIDLI